MVVYFFMFRKQESFLFYPEKLPGDFSFSFSQQAEEVFIPMADGNRLHGLLFETPDPRGIIFYLHGNGGSLRSWGDLAPVYTGLGYNLFMLDYRGYGKSEGKIAGEALFLNDIREVYDALKSRFPQLPFVVLGYSMGTGPAAWLASQNPCDLLILEAPYYSIEDLKNQWYPLVPGFLLKYKFETFRYLEQVKVPVIIFHGVQDEVISFESSVKLKHHLKKGDLFIPLQGQPHNGITYNLEYHRHLQQHLSKILP